MKPALLISFFSFFAILSCKNDCYNCVRDGAVESVCKRHYSKEAEFKAELDSAARYGWECLPE